MSDGITGRTGIWKGYAAKIASLPVHLVSAHSLPTDNHFMRYVEYLPIVPGVDVASIVAARNPEYAETIKKAIVYWIRLKRFGAKVYDTAKLDVHVIEDCKRDTWIKFQHFVASGLKDDAHHAAKTLDALEEIALLAEKQPNLEAIVIETAKRTLSFFKFAEPDIDLIFAGGVWATARWRFRAENYFVQGSLTKRRPQMAFDEEATFDVCDPTTGEQCMQVDGVKGLGYVLSDFCKDKAQDVTVTWYDNTAYHRAIQELNLMFPINTLRSVILRLEAGLDPSSSAIRFGELSQFQIPKELGAKQFWIRPAISFTHAQDFFVSNGTVLLSTPSSREGVYYDNRIFDGNVLKFGEPTLSMDERIESGTIVQERCLAVCMARRAIRHARSKWAINAALHRVRIAVGPDRSAEVVEIQEPGKVLDFTASHSSVIKAFQRIRRCYLKNIQRHIAKHVGGKPVVENDMSIIARSELQSQRCGTQWGFEQSVVERLIYSETSKPRSIGSEDMQHGNEFLENIFQMLDLGE